MSFSLTKKIPSPAGEEGWIISALFPFMGLQAVEAAFGDWSPWKQVNGAVSLPVWRK